jgi:magnesium transporter
MGTNFTVEFFKAGLKGFFLMIAGILSLIFVVLLVARRQRWI